MDRSNPIKKIAVIGPESTGKSTMSNFLAKRYKTIAVPEYARYYCKDLNRNYTLQDEVNMFYGQIALEESIIPLANNNLLICDTTILTIKVWCDHLFNFTPKQVIDEIADRKYDGYLLMDIDLPWEDDPLRDFPNLRQHFMEIWKKELTHLSADFIIVSDLGETRLQNGYNAVQKLLSKNE